MDASAVLTSLLREERGRLVASLVRTYGFDLAEESVDAAVEAALQQWPREGSPASPRAWLSSVARRKAIDAVRHRAMASQVHSDLGVVGDERDEGPEVGEALPDERLRLVFTCCHPALARETQVSLALRWLCGLSTEDVARAFMVPVATMAQRLTRAKSKIEVARIPYEVPERGELAARLDAVLEVVYAIFNEGYVATSGGALQRVDLADEALYLAELLVRLMPRAVEPMGLLALLCLVHARRSARCADDGSLVPLEEQDRARWDEAQIARGKAVLREALEAGPPSAYAIEAAIQALHDEAPSYAQTDFAQIAALYGVLARYSDEPLVALNEAVARAMVDGPERALDAVLALERAGSLKGHPALCAAKADLLRRCGRTSEARDAYDEAIAATKNEVERRFLRARRSSL